MSLLTNSSDDWALFESLRIDLVTTIGASASANTNTRARSENKAMCDYCFSDQVCLEEGNFCCKACHSIVGRYIDQSAEWRFYGCDDNKGADPTRCGMPTSDLLPDSSLGAMIGYSYNESYDVRLMRKYQMWNSMPYRERNLYNIFDALTNSAINNGISKSIIEEAKMLYKQVSESRISRGDNRSGLIASSIYISCKNNKVPRSCKEIAKIFNLKTTTMTRGCKKFAELMKLNMASSTADDFISRFCSKLGLDTEQKDMCKHVIKKAEEFSIVSENTPPSVAAGTIYMCNMICEWGIGKQTLSDSCDISQVTINKCYKKMVVYKKMLLPEATYTKFVIV